MPVTTLAWLAILLSRLGDRNRAKALAGNGAGEHQLAGDQGDQQHQ